MSNGPTNRSRSGHRSPDDERGADRLQTQTHGRVAVTGAWGQRQHLQGTTVGGNIVVVNADALKRVPREQKLILVLG